MEIVLIENGNCIVLKWQKNPQETSKELQKMANFENWANFQLQELKLLITQNDTKVLNEKPKNTKFRFYTS
jgi:hypothetical protein